MPSIRTWRILAAINFPQAVIPTAPPEPGDLLPQSIKLTTRIPENEMSVVNGILVSLKPWRGPQLPLEFFGAPFDLAALELITKSESGVNALESVEDLLESIIDDLSFQLQAAVFILQLEVLDITPPLSIGIEREFLLFPFPNGFGSPKYLRSITIDDWKTVFTPKLRSDYSIQSEKSRAALRWYVKGLAASFDIDKFSFFWIALEILCSQSGVVMKKPYETECGHEITNCPICSAPILRIVNGPTITAFLIENIGLTSEIAKELWKTRQLFHGANQLNHHAVNDLPRLVLVLRHAVLRALKQALLIESDQLPTSSIHGSPKNQNVGIIGTRQIAEYDLLI